MIQEGGDCDGFRLGGEEKELFVIRQLSHLDPLSLSQAAASLVCLFSGGPGSGGAPSGRLRA